MKGRILLVDDDPAILKYCARLLAYENYAVTSCSTAACAAAAISSGERFDILLTDFYLGDGFGSELIKLIKSCDPSARTMMMSGDESLAGTRGPGPDYADYETLIKPFQTEDLLAGIKELMGKAAPSKRNNKKVQLDPQ
jgi:DNA-binding NtrC family response regulator